MNYVVYLNIETDSYSVGNFVTPVVIMYSAMVVNREVLSYLIYKYGSNHVRNIKFIILSGILDGNILHLDNFQFDGLVNMDTVHGEASIYRVFGF